MQSCDFLLVKYEGCWPMGSVQTGRTLLQLCESPFRYLKGTGGGLKINIQHPSNKCRSFALVGGLTTDVKDHPAKEPLVSDGSTQPLK